MKLIKFFYLRNMRKYIYAVNITQYV